MAKELDPELLIVCPIPPYSLAEGEEIPEWGPHITLMPWFTVDNLTVIRSKLLSLAHNQPPFTVQVGEDAKFGPQADVPVQLVEPNASLSHLHKNALEVVRARGRVSNDRVGNDYRPHITEQRGQRFEKGARITLSEIALVKGTRETASTPRLKQVDRRYPLGRYSSVGHEATT